MITKLKICSVCEKESVLWKANPKLCKNCAMRSKPIVSKASFKPLTQTTDGKTARVFKVGYKTKEIKKVSTRQQKLLAAYKALRDAFMKSRKFCEARLDGCTINATECHHKAGRGEYLLDDSKYMALCHNCHQFITDHPAFAMEKNFCESRLSKAI